MNGSVLIILYLLVFSTHTASMLHISLMSAVNTCDTVQSSPFLCTQVEAITELILLQTQSLSSEMVIFNIHFYSQDSGLWSMC